MATTTPPLIDDEAAQHFLELLGKDPEATATRFRFFAHKSNPAKGRIGPGPKIGGFNAEAIEAQHRQQRGAYVVIGHGGDRDADITGVPALFVEWDGREEAWQLNAWRVLGLPEPSLMVSTGGSSIHCYWLLHEPLDPQVWRPIQVRLIAMAGGDTTCCNPSRVMRLPGAWYIDGTGMATAQTAIVHETDCRYSAGDLVAAMDAAEPDRFDFTIPPESMVGVSIPTGELSRREFPVRPMEQIKEALAAIPQRVGGGDESYGKYRNILWGLIKACEEVGSSREEAISLMEQHSPSATCNWNVQQTAISGGQQISADTFWWHARAAGWRPAGDTPSRVIGAGNTPIRAPGEIDPDLDMQRKAKRRTLAPDEVVDLLPERIGGMPRHNIRTNNFHAGENLYTADDLARIYIHLSNSAERWPKETTADAVVELAKHRAYDPVEEELNRIGATIEPLPLDQWSRLDLHLLGIDDPVAAAFLPQFLLSAVARVFRPGCGVRRSPVLIGAQWRGKTRLGRILFGSDNWIENVSDLGKDDLLRLQAGWGIELSELNGLTRRKDQEALKAFLTATEDVYRAPYGKGVARYQRRCVFWGTSNGPPLRDLSGSTRFVCVQIPDRMLPLDWATANREAIWSRAVALYRLVEPGQEPWDHSTEEERKAIEERNTNHQEIDPWADEVTEILMRSVDLPVSIPRILDLMEIPKGQRSNATASRIRQLAEVAGWVLERRTVLAGNTRRQGLWPALKPEPELCHPE